MSRVTLKGRYGEAGILLLQTYLLALGVSYPEMISTNLACQ